MNRRDLMKTTALAGAALAARKVLAAPPPPRVTVPNGRTASWRLVDGTKVFHLVAEPVKHEFAPGLAIEAWGYNGGTPGPLIEATEGDRVRIYVTNKLPEPTTVHWHGMILPNGMDGVAGLTQPAIAPGQTFKYEFALKRAGTFLYHPHADEMTQIALGMVGMVVVHPRDEARPARDYALIAHEWKVPIGAARPDPLAMTDFNVLTFNSKCFPATEPLAVQTGDRVRIRLGNIGPMDHHPIHLHGHAFEVVETDGGPVPPSARVPGDDRARARRGDPRDRIHGDARRLAAALPHDPPRDEPDGPRRREPDRCRHARPRRAARARRPRLHDDGADRHGRDDADDPAAQQHLDGRRQGTVRGDRHGRDVHGS